ncbi:MAG: ABC transporter substrate-binding protein [Bacilli bacterium]|nr:ABC transporter substrate-binding protein [Bacilli bacterium]
MKKTRILFTALVGTLFLAACGPKKTSSEFKCPEGESVNTPVEVDQSKLAQGAQSYVYASAADRTNILGTLEKYAVDQKLTGLTLFENGGYVMYADNIVKGTNNYIPGYGFGILGEGSINADLPGESNSAWKRYYHTFQTDDPATLNYMNSTTSVVGTLMGYTSGSYWGTEMNETKDGYNWVASLAKENRPIAMDADPDTHMATTFKFHVKTGSEFKYRTNSSTFAAYNNREVALEDYVTPYKIYYTQQYGLARSTDNLTGSGSIAGGQDVYNATKNTEVTDEIWENIGIKTGTDADGDYMQFTFNVPCTSFFAMYYLASGMFAPVPAQFITELGNGSFADGVAAWGNFSKDLKLSPLDTWLCTGSYALERWDNNKQIVYQVNPNSPDAANLKIPGVHINILSAAKQDQEAALKEFLAGKLSAVGIPSTKLDEYKNDPRTTMTSGDSTFKLNMNTCDQERWEELFGEEGAIKQTEKADHWKCEPAMTNKNFVDGLSFAIDRKTLAVKNGRTPSSNYFATEYMIDPENGISYNSTKAHKDAVAEMAEGTDGYGYSLEKAKASFKQACQDLICAGVYEKGDTIDLEVAWMETVDFDTMGNAIKNNLEDAFNSCDGGLYLNVTNWAGQQWSDVYYKKMMVGQFDIAFGSISGNTYDPLNFLEVLKSDNSSNFTLNWGADTNAVDGKIFYDNKYWSFDALWTAADHGAYVIDGQNAPMYQFQQASLATVNADGSWTVEFGCELANTTDAKAVVVAAVAYGYVDPLDEDTYDEYEVEMELSADGKKITVTIDAELVEYFGAFVEAMGYIGVDFYGYTEMFGTAGSVSYWTSVFAVAPQA